MAKRANHIPKTAEPKPGSYPAHVAQVCNLASLTHDERQALLRGGGGAMGAVWGVGRRIAAQLIEAGVHNGQDLVQLDY